MTGSSVREPGECDRRIDRMRQRIWGAEDTNTDEICRVWTVGTDGTCENNGRPDAIAGWGVFFGEEDERQECAYRIERAVTDESEGGATRGNMNESQFT